MACAQRAELVAEYQASGHGSNKALDKALYASSSVLRKLIATLGDPSVLLPQVLLRPDPQPVAQKRRDRQPRTSRKAVMEANILSSDASDTEEAPASRDRNRGSVTEGDQSQVRAGSSDSHVSNDEPRRSGGSFSSRGSNMVGNRSDSHASLSTGQAPVLVSVPQDRASRAIHEDPSAGLRPTSARPSSPTMLRSSAEEGSDRSVRDAGETEAIADVARDLLGPGWNNQAFRFPTNRRAAVIKSLETALATALEGLLRDGTEVSVPTCFDST